MSKLSTKLYRANICAIIGHHLAFKNILSHIQEQHETVAQFKRENKLNSLKQYNLRKHI